MARLNDTEKLAAAQRLADVLDGYMLSDIASQLTCTEADAVAAFVAAFVGEGLADEFLACHIDSDEPGDRHYPEGEEQ